MCFVQFFCVVFCMMDEGWMGFHCFSVHRQWLEDALKENDPTAVQLYLVGTKKDLSVSLCSV